MPGLTPAMRAAMAAFKRDTALNERITDAYNKFNKEVPYDRQVPLAAWKELPEGKAAVAAILAGAGASSSGAAPVGSSDSIRATPEANPIIASFARGLKSADTFARKPFGYDNPPAAAISSLLGIPAIQRTMERVGYGEPLTNVGKANVSLMTEDTGEALMAAPQFLSPAAKLAQMTKGLPVGAIIRNTGDNNFLKGSVENALKGLKGSIREYRPPAFPDLPAPGIEEALAGQNARAASVNKFVEGPLTRYVKNQMATPDDPVRALAEQGVLHFDAGITPTVATRAGALRGRAGFAPLGEGKSDMARAWEATSDANIDAYKAKQFQGDALVDNPWLATKPPETNVYGMDVLNPTATADRLGFTHLTDELRNALNPESGLPRNLLLTPEKLQNFGMERAVRHVAAINDWRAAQVAEANAQKANNAATVLHKEYPHTPETPNPKGLRWVELKAPKNLEIDRKRLLGEDFDSPFAPSDDVLMSGERSKVLSDALKYEGDTMKHCVGGYCDDVLSGQKRIFSLRDAKGEPHVTIHTEPDAKRANFDRLVAEGWQPGEVPLLDEHTKTLEAAASKMDFEFNPRDASYTSKSTGQPLSYSQDIVPQIREVLKSKLGNDYEALASRDYAPPDRIVQIKRKANLVNSDPYEYRPFVQDFVKSGKWSDVGDMANTGLVRVSDRGNEPFIGAVREQLGEYVTPEQWDAVMQGKINIPGYATGGRVSMIHPAAAIQPLVRVPGFDKF